MKHCIPEEVKKNVFAEIGDARFARRYEWGNTGRPDVLAEKEVLLWHKEEGRTIGAASGRVPYTSGVARQEHGRLKGKREVS